MGHHQLGLRLGHRLGPRRVDDRLGGGRLRRDEGLHLLEAMDLRGEAVQLLVESRDLAGALQLHQLPLVVAELAHGVTKLGLGAHLQLLPAELAELPRLGQQPVERRGDHVGVGPELVHHVGQPGPVVRPHLGPYRLGRPGTRGVQPADPPHQFLAGGQQALDLLDVVRPGFGHGLPQPGYGTDPGNSFQSSEKGQ